MLFLAVFEVASFFSWKCSLWLWFLCKEILLPSAKWKTTTKRTSLRGWSRQEIHHSQLMLRLNIVQYRINSSFTVLRRVQYMKWKRFFFNFSTATGLLNICTWWQIKFIVGTNHVVGFTNKTVCGLWIRQSVLSPGKQLRSKKISICHPSWSRGLWRSWAASTRTLLRNSAGCWPPEYRLWSRLYNWLKSCPVYVHLL